jgi:hypothetical protein
VPASPPSTVPITEARAVGVSEWLPALPLLVVVAYLVAFLTWRSFPPFALGVLLLPALTAWRIPELVACDRGLRWAIFAMLAMAAWGLVQLGWRTPLVDLGLGHAAVLAASTAAAIAVATGRAGPRALIPALGVSALLAIPISIHGVWLTHYDGFGFGNINQLVNIGSPIALAWCALIVCRRAAAEAVPRWEYPAAAALVALMLYEVFWSIPGVPRRGVLVAAAVVLAWFAMRWLWRRRRPVALALLAVVGVAALALGARAFTHPVADPRVERVQLYAAAAETAAAELPWGGGAYTSLRLDSFHGEMTRHLTATNTWTFHMHCELLEQLMNGGLPGAALLLGWVAIVARRTLRIADAPSRHAATAAGIAMVVHANTDNLFAVPSCLACGGVIVGMMLRCPVIDAPTPTRWLRPVALAIAVACLPVAARELRPTGLSVDAEPAARLAALRDTTQADFAVTQWTDGFDRLFAAASYDEAAAYTVVVNRKTGGGSNAVLAESIIAQHVGDERRERLRVALRSIGAGAWRELPAALAAASEVAAADADELRATLLYLNRTPFNRLGYDHLGGILDRRPDLVPTVAHEYVVRLRYRRGDPGLPEPGWLRDAASAEPAPRGIDDAADLMAGLMWAFMRGYPPRTISAGLEPLVRRYGDIPDVCLLVVELARDLPADAFPWRPSQHPILMRAAEKIYPGDKVRLLQSIAAPAQAESEWPLLRGIFPRTARSFEHGGMDPQRDQNEAVWAELARIWGLAGIRARAHLAAPQR